MAIIYNFDTLYADTSQNRQTELMTRYWCEINTHPKTWDNLN